MSYSPDSARSATRNLRIGEVAARTGLTPRTIRYYEELGLLPDGEERAKGKHRHYGADDVERLALLARLRDLLDLSLEELDDLVAEGTAWTVQTRPWRESESMIERMRVIDEALAHIDRQLALVRARTAALAELEQELLDRRLGIESKRLTGP
jgi:DNA-binding transcriptional MerR regulator